MQKLINLLNEYETPKSWIVFKSYDAYDWTFYWVDCDWETEIAWSDSYICGKRYKFIEWLVENDKIDFNFVERVWSWDFIYDMDSPYYNRCTCEDLEEYNDVDRVLMLLAISDTPIDDLCSYLKD